MNKKIGKNTKNLKVVFAFCLGVVLSATGVYAATQVNAKDVSFSSYSMSATNVKDAIDSIYNYDTKNNKCPDNTKCLNKICRRATTLHTEECKNSNCGSTSKGDKITYGNLGTKGVLTSGDAFDCDVNGDGEYDPETERFYYVSPYYNTSSKEFNSNYATLVYYKNYDNYNDLVMNYSTVSLDYITAGSIPCGFVNHTITNASWPGVSLINTERLQLDDQGSSKYTIDYEPFDSSSPSKVARALTYQEIQNCISTSNGNETISHSCEFLLENTKYSSSELPTTSYKNSDGYWLETIKSPILTSTSAWVISGIEAGPRTSTVYYDNLEKAPHTYGFRPTIEVSLLNIEY